ncbi:DUF934 domain-containing protein [Bosea sp. 117]|uniref:DUF934 domain-containing protein n=1 Tax=Bosea sp. 117 TaxID=1125973 RepID=UPI0004949896|nr:DUF934 domain-containing protein [Bosea sp. 117]
MKLIENGHVIADRYVRVADDEALPEGAPVLVSADRLLREGAELARRGAPVGVVWPNNRRIEAIEPYLDQLALIALVFPTFRDGRAYSQARLLRERFDWQGPLRATGNVLRDQFLYMSRAGFDQLEATKDADADAYVDELKSYTAFYQPTGDGRPTILRARLGRVAEAPAQAEAAE